MGVLAGREPGGQVGWVQGEVEVVEEVGVGEDGGGALERLGQGLLVVEVTLDDLDSLCGQGSGGIA